MIAGVVLAAGESSRLGVPKQLLVYQGVPLIAYVVDKLLRSQVDEVIVVLGSKAEEVNAALAGYPVKVVINREYRAGQSTSLKAGLAALSGAVKGALFALGDQPLVSIQTIDLLIKNYRLSGGIIAPYFNGKRGNPVIFDRKYFAAMLSLSGDVGAREVLRRHPESLIKVDVLDRGVVFDVDTWEDYHELLNWQA